MSGAAPMRGEIWWFCQGDAAERRPVLVVQNDVGNLRARTVIVAAVSSAVPDRSYPQLVTLPTPLLGRPAVVRCDVLHTVSKSRLEERAVQLPLRTMREVDLALSRSLALR